MVGSFRLAELVQDLSVLCLSVIVIVIVVLITVLYFVCSMFFLTLPIRVLVHRLKNNVISDGRPSIVDHEQK
jgi:hypothetical protein